MFTFFKPCARSFRMNHKRRPAGSLPPSKPPAGPAPPRRSVCAPAAMSHHSIADQPGKGERTMSFPSWLRRRSWARTRRPRPRSVRTNRFHAGRATSAGGWSGI